MLVNGYEGTDHQVEPGETYLDRDVSLNLHLVENKKTLFLLKIV